MTNRVEEPRTAQGARRSLSSGQPRRERRRNLLDRLATHVVAAGGFAIIASILAILLFILFEIAPLFKPASVTKLADLPVKNLLSAADQSKVVAMGLHENQEIGYLVSEGGFIHFFTPGDSVLRESISLDQHGALVSSVVQSLKGEQLVLGTTTGGVLFVEIDFGTHFLAGKRAYTPRIAAKTAFQIDESGGAIRNVAFAGDLEESLTIAALTSDDRLMVIVHEKEQSLFGESRVEVSRFEVEPIWSARQRAVAIDASRGNLYTGSETGKLYHWRLDSGTARFVSSTMVNRRKNAAITSLNFLLGGRTLVVSTEDGKVSSWFLVRDATSDYGWRLTRIREMFSHKSEIVAVAPSARGKGFISGDREGNLLLQYSTSGRLLASFALSEGAGVRFINFAPKANAALVLDTRGYLTHWQVDNPHPEAGLNAFFGKVWYEGYEKPEHVWQSTGGSDEFEPKLSLVPLIFGSLKGTLYTLLISIPLAILAALYTSQFMHPTLRNKVKPTIEIMAALPSVVLGFLGGLWLAPRIEHVVPALATAAIVLPLLIIAASFIWTRLPMRLRNGFRPGIEWALIVPVLLLGAWLCYELNGLVEGIFFAADFKTWLNATMGLSYDQRNALVVGIVMGFAVIPVIYTISEDALSNVPRNLVSGSLALGATRWQTAIRVVLPTAAAGIFSAIMIGLGRAVGETMIVLMATGNTPLMEWNIFNGFRTLSANIAVEIPEAPLGGTLYRVLFLAAMLLFVMTFVVNTFAEIVRQRLREKYQKL